MKPAAADWQNNIELRFVSLAEHFKNSHGYIRNLLITHAYERANGEVILDTVKEHGSVDKYFLKLAAAAPEQAESLKRARESIRHLRTNALIVARMIDGYKCAFPDRANNLN